MTPEQFDRVRELLLEVKDQPTDQRIAHVLRACNSEPLLVTELQGMFSSLSNGDSPIDLPVMGIEFHVRSLLQPEHSIPTLLQIDRYRILDLIGEGGIGVVYRAEQQEPIKRIVAIKVIKAGFDTKEVVSRFKAERQALALMEHPSIARVFDAGETCTSHPYFVMEYVPGDAVTKFCDSQRFGIRRRLEIFLQICEAIGHAHVKGMVHRDIKAANVLAYLQERQCAIKVIDFGLVKALINENAPVRSQHTEGGQILGTYETMSPEQASGAIDIDTRTDIYSLGVLLYELLAGVVPFDRAELFAGGSDEARKRIQDIDPPRPSKRFSRLNLEQRKSIADDRSTDIASLERALRGDLDAIVVRCLEKERQHRYETVNALAADIKHYFTNEPVVAQPPSAAYRFRKLVRRNRLLFASIVAVLMVLISGLIATGLEAIRARRSEKAARLSQIAALDARSQSDEAANRLRRLLYAAEMSMATDSSDLPSGISHARELLSHWQSGTPDLRGWEWYYLNNLSHRELLTLRGHNDIIWCVAWNPTSTRLATAGRGIIKIWDAATGKDLMTLRGYEQIVRWVAWSPDGNRLASASDDHTIRIWDAITGRMLLTVHNANENEKGPFCVGWSPDGTRIVSNGAHFTVRVWDSTSGQEVRSMPGHTHSILAVAWSPDGNRIASCAQDNTVRVWGADNGEEQLVFKGHTQEVRCIAWSPDSKLIASGANDNLLKIWDASTGKEQKSFRAAATQVWSLTWSPDGHHLATTSPFDSTVCLWDYTAINVAAGTLRGHAGVANFVAWSSDGKQIATASEDGTAKLWDPTAPTEPYLLKGHTANVQSIAWSPDGSRLASMSYDRTVKLWNCASAKAILSIPTDPAKVSCATWSADGDHLATGSASGTVCIWDVPSGKTAVQLYNPTSQITGLEWCPDQTRIASTGPHDPIKIWDVSDGKEILTIPHTSGERSIAWSPDGKRLFSAGGSQSIEIWDASNGAHIASFPKSNRPAFTMSMSHDHTRLATGHEDGTVQIWDVQTARRLLTFHGHTAGVLSIFWNPQDTRIASACRDHTVRIWDPASGAEYMTLHNHDSPAVWSPDGMRLACEAADGLIEIRDASRGYKVGGPNE